MRSKPYSHVYELSRDISSIKMQRRPDYYFGRRSRCTRQAAVAHAPTLTGHGY